MGFLNIFIRSELKGAHIEHSIWLMIITYQQVQQPINHLYFSQMPFAISKVYYASGDNITYWYTFCNYCDKREQKDTRNVQHKQVSQNSCKLFFSFLFISFCRFTSFHGNFLNALIIMQLPAQRTFTTFFLFRCEELDTLNKLIFQMNRNTENLVKGMLFVSLNNVMLIY